MLVTLKGQHNLLFLRSHHTASEMRSQKHHTERKKIYQPFDF